MIIVLLLVLCINSNTSAQTNNNDKELIELMNIEFKIVEQAYADCISGPCYGDSIYYKNWLDGLLCEKNEEYNDAIEFYKKAYNYDRFELSTYDIEFSLGRVEIRAGNHATGKQYLKKFIINADNDLHNEYSMWEFSEEAEKELETKIEYAKKLIEKYK